MRLPLTWVVDENAAAPPLVANSVVAPPLVNSYLFATPLVAPTLVNGHLAVTPVVVPPLCRGVNEPSLGEPRLSRLACLFLGQARARVEPRLAARAWLDRVLIELELSPQARAQLLQKPNTKNNQNLLETKHKKNTQESIVEN
jgi:hypothetical protein